MSSLPPAKVPGLNADQWRDKLLEIASHLKQPTSLCLIGSMPAMLGGQPNRVSIDLDTWKKATTYGYADLRQAVEKAGLVFDPKGEMDPNQPYIQLVERGIHTEIGKFTEQEEIMREGQLVVNRVPWENIVASKLTMMRPKDIEDVTFIVNTYGVTKDQVVEVLKSFPRDLRDSATENLIYFEVIAPKKRPPLPTPSPKRQPRRDSDMDR